MGFSELKKEIGIESSGHLQFHLGKLAHLVGTNAEGSYSLTDDGREALRALRSTQSEGKIPKAGSVSVSLRNWRKPFLAGLLAAVVVLGVVAVYQQQQIATLNRELDPNTIVIGSTRYWYESFPVGLPNGTSITFHDVIFTYLTPLAGIHHDGGVSGTVRLSNGSVVPVTDRTTVQECCFLNYVLKTNPVTQVSTGLSLDTSVVITFPNRVREVYDRFDVTILRNLYLAPDYNPTQINIKYFPPASNPWFSENQNPHAGVFWNYTNFSNTFTFYVSVSG